MPNTVSESDYLEVVGARVHNLKNIDVTIPRNQLVVITGLSGSGKSSLAFDTIYAEGQRRYIESFSAYARQFLGNMERPDVDKITGLSPVISIEQKTVNKNPRSTVGTITEIYDFLRLLYARASDAYSYVTGEKMVRYSDDQILNLILENFDNKKILILAPVVKGRKGHYRELFEQIKKWGFLRVRIDGDIVELTKRIQLDRYKVHDIEIVIDRLEVNAEARQRINESLQLAMKQGKGIMMVQPFEIGDFDEKFGKIEYYSRHLMCPTSGISYDEPQPNLFSFNSPYGACPKCNGLGVVSEIDINKIIPDKKSTIRKGAIAPLGPHKGTWIFKQIEAIGEKFGFTLDTIVEDISEEAMNVILFGSDDVFKIKQYSDSSATSYSIAFEGIANFIAKQNDEQSSPTIEKWIQGFMNKIPCPKCEGTRLKNESLHFKIADMNIAQLANMGILELNEWFKDIEKKLSTKQNTIAKEVLKEIRTRIQFLLDVGLDYLSLNRSSRTLSGGEAQRIRLATQIGSQLVGVLYILDEPSIGLHQRDNVRLINALKNLRDIGNSVIVVEHDKDMILTADHVLDIGPAAGIHGGKVIAQGTPKEILKFHTLTADYINGVKEIKVPKERRKGSGKSLILKGATGNNLKNVSISLPLGKMICVTGVSGSGKSTLINETLYPILNKHFYRSEKKPMPYKSISGLEHLDKVIDIDQSPIGRTPRSNPATYTNVFGDIRTLFSEIPEAKIRGYKPGRFSFNVKGGRCETCQGAGLRTIEMNFLPDVYVNCETCNGKRYNKETLEIRYKGKSISDVLNMTIENAVDFFESIPSILQKIKTLKEVGLGYITLGQQSTTLSGGEAQRVKLATELSKRDTGNTFYILDEPTTGLHFEDIRILLEVLNKLVDSGNTVLIIEHNMDIIKVSDHVIDLGLEGGNNGGTILCEGTPEEVAKDKVSYTAKFLKQELK
ncbi:MAG TPA: excinuclease ABC subunit UvrA [Bacteroidia bacterium]|jgi:excinuclease ABC subunit A|nr:excinuclease ABC subunit UvrA [Bacteroidia bacterium]